MDKSNLVDAWFDETVETQRFKVIEDFGEDNQPRMRIQGVCQRADKENKNNRIYPKSVLENAIKRFETRINLGRAFGEVDHPEWRPALTNTSHLIDKVWWDKRDSTLLCTEVTVTNTPKGEIIKEIVRAGGRPGFSSRGYGDSDKKKIGSKEVEVIKDGFDLHSFDFVINPSVTSAKIKRVIEDADKKFTVEENMEIKNVEDLRKAFPEFVKAVEDKVIADAETVLNEDVKNKKPPESSEQEKALQKKVDDLTSENDQLKSDAVEKDTELEKYSTFVSGTTKLMQDNEFLSKKETPSENVEVENLKVTVSSLEEENKKLKAEQKKGSDKINDLEGKVTKGEVEAHVANLLKGNPYATALREKLKDCKTVEEVDTRMDEEKTFITSLEENFGKNVPSGKGSEEVGGEGDVDEEKKKVREEAKRLAGVGGTK